MAISSDVRLSKCQGMQAENRCSSSAQGLMGVWWWGGVTMETSKQAHPREGRGGMFARACACLCVTGWA